jgi:hypothetical protein
LASAPDPAAAQGEALTCFCVANYGVSDLMNRALARLAAAGGAAADAAAAAAAAAADPAARRAALFVDDLQLGTQRGLQVARARALGGGGGGGAHAVRGAACACFERPGGGTPAPRAHGPCMGGWECPPHPPPAPPPVPPQTPSP